jgi:plastocyanin
MKHTALAILVALAVALMAPLASSAAANGNSALIATAGPSAATESPAVVASVKPAATVHIRNFAYHENKVTIHAGQTVLFVNDDDDAHTVTAADKSYDSGGLDRGESWTRTFTKPGTYAYFCALHPYMKAVVVVLAPAPKGN